MQKLTKLKKKTNVKIISLILSVIMVVAMLPITVFADDSAVSVDTDTNTPINANTSKSDVSPMVIPVAATTTNASIQVSAQSNSVVFGGGTTIFSVSGTGLDSTSTPVIEWKTQSGFSNKMPAGISVGWSSNKAQITFKTTKKANAGEYVFKIVSGENASNESSLIIDKAQFSVKNYIMTVRPENQTPIAKIGLPSLPAGASYGDVTVISNFGLVNGTPTISNNKISIPVDRSKTTVIETLGIAVNGGQNYIDYIMNGKIKVSYKSYVAIDGLSAPLDLRYTGEPIKNIDFGTPQFGASWNGTLDYTYYEGEDVNGTKLAEPPKDAGTYTVVASIPESDNDYIGLAEVTFTINKADITVTADDKAMVIFEPLPTFTATYSGFVGADNADNALQTKAIAECAANGKTVGKFDITFKTNAVLNDTASLNYNIINHNDGTLNVKSNSYYYTGSLASYSNYTSKVISGADQKIIDKSDSTAVFKIDVPFKEFIYAEAGKNVLVSDKDYTAVEGSTIITLSSSYLNTLDVGKHTVRVEFISGYAELNFEIIPKIGESTLSTVVTAPKVSRNPQTSDSIFSGLFN